MVVLRVLVQVIEFAGKAVHEALSEACGEAPNSRLNAGVVCFASSVLG